MAVSKTAARGSIPRSPAELIIRPTAAVANLPPDGQGWYEAGAGDATGDHALLALAVVTAGVSLALSLGPGVAPASAACPHARAHPHDVALPKIRKAITCLVNKKREKRDRHLLEPNAQAGARRAPPYQGDARRGLLPAPMPG